MAEREDFLNSILEESPLYFSLQNDERRVIVEKLMNSYSSTFGSKKQKIKKKKSSRFKKKP
jgi:hypothetical protein